MGPRQTGRRPGLRRLSGVAAAGGAGWLVDVSVLWLAHEVAGLPVSAAAALGFVCSGVVNFTVNRLVFAGRGRPGGRQVVRYLVLFLANLAVVSALVPVLAAAWGQLLAGPGVGVLLAKVVVTAILLPVNSFCYHRWVFH